MTRDQAIEIAQEAAKLLPESYYSEPFQPHEWVIEAILMAFCRGVASPQRPPNVWPGTERVG